MPTSSTSRPSPDEILKRWETLLNDPLLSFESLKRKAAEGELDKSLRSLCWRYFFGLLPSPSSLSADTGSTSNSTTYSTYSLLLSRQRSEYSDLRERFLRAPDGGWIKDGETNEDGNRGRTSSENGGEKSATGRPVKVDAKVNNPLGLEEDNPWQSWFADLDLRKTIRQDVQRTFPEIEYFRLAPTQNQLTDLLFIYTKLTPDVGYRQGMHELLAPLLWIVDLDSLHPDRANEDSLPHLVLSSEFVEHDTWSLFSTLMKSCAPFYDHKATIPLSKTPQRPQVTGLGLSAVSASSSTSTLVQPIVAIAVHLHSLLSTLDPQLHATFTRLQIEPQLYAIRWLRLLFSREFPLSETLTLWDGIFARDPSLQITQHVAAAMLLRIRDALITAERIGGYGEFLQVLLRYPACPDGTFRTSLLLLQANYLRDNLSYEGAEYIRRQNLELGVTQAHEGGDEETDLRSPAARGAHGQRRSANGAVPPVSGVALLGEGGLVGDLAKGVYGRAEALGINKAILGTFNDIRRGVTAAQAQLEEQRQRQRGQFSQIPSRAPWESPTQSFDPSSQLRSELAQIRSSNIAMASALELCVTVLEKALIPPTPDPSSSADNGQRTAEAQSNSKSNLGNHTGSASSSLAPQMMAITAVKHVRDVLGGQAKSFDSSVLGPLQQTLDQLTKSPPLPPLPFDSPFLASQPEESDPDPPLDSTSTHENVPLQPPSSSQSSFPPAQRAMPAVHSRSTPPSSPPIKASPSPNPYISSRSDKPLPSLTRTPQLPSSSTPTASSPSSSDPVTSFNSSRRPSPLLTSYAGSSPAPSRPTSTSSSPPIPIKSLPSPTPRTPFDPLGVL